LLNRLVSSRFVDADEAIRLDRQPAVSTPVRWSHRIEYAALRFLIGLFSSLPRALALRVGAAITSLVYVVDWKRRRIGLRNLSIAFPEKSLVELRAVLRCAYRNLGRSAAESVQLVELNPRSVRDYVRIEDPERWQQAVNRPGGTIIITAHFGSWELLAYAQGLLGRPVTIVHKPFPNPLVDHVVNYVRARAGTRHLKKKRAAREALRALREGALLVTPVDQNQKRHDGVFVELFGVPACTTSGPARLALRTGVPIVPAFLVRDGESDQHRLIVLSDVEIVRTGDREADIVATMQRCSNVIEQMLRQYPEQWIWFHRRWRTRPEGEREFY
jgi:Kdo2-lipid IVA lauroyltransferase/acyltransferase